MPGLQIERVIVGLGAIEILFLIEAAAVVSRRTASHPNDGLGNVETNIIKK